jgi:hypothetical protein
LTEAAVSEAFKTYAWTSVRVDQYFNSVNIFALHYRSFKFAYSRIPSRNSLDSLPSLDKEISDFLISAVSALNYMATINIFNEQVSDELKNLDKDLIIFAFSTCFCFQWSLFEDFTRSEVTKLADMDLLPPRISNQLKRRQRQTEGFLKYIDSGAVFGRSPFETVLPVPGWIFSTERCGYGDLDRIRKMRNAITHGNQVLLDEANESTDRVYQRSMWILRQFAANIDQEIRNTFVKSNSD